MPTYEYHSVVSQNVYVRYLETYLQKKGFEYLQDIKLGVQVFIARVLTLQRRFPLKYVNLCQFPHKLYLQLVRKLTQVKPFKPLELSPYYSLTYLFMLTSNIRTYPYYLANLSLTKLAIVVVGL